MHFFSFRLLRIFTSLDFRFSGYFHRCWIFSVYSDFIFLFTNSECICDWTLINPRLFCWPSRFRFFVFRKFPDNEVLSRKVLRFVYICETEERGLRYDLSDYRFRLFRLKWRQWYFPSRLSSAREKKNWRKMYEDCPVTDASGSMGETKVYKIYLSAKPK